MPVLPPGDLRMALAALSGDGERGRSWRACSSTGSAAPASSPGTRWATWCSPGSPRCTAATRCAPSTTSGELLGCRGRVLPMADVPLDLVARVESADPDDPERTRTIRGQVAIATTPGHVPRDPAVAAGPAGAPTPSSRRSPPPTSSRSARGPGTPPCCRTCSCRGCGRRWPRPPARVVVVLNLEPQPGETDGFSPEEHLHVLQAHLGGVALHTVIADADSVVDRRGLLSAVRECGAELILAPVAEADGLATARSRALVRRPGLRGRDAVRESGCPIGYRN